MANARTLLTETAKSQGFKVESWVKDYCVLKIARAFPPPDYPKLIANLSNYGFSVRPTTRPDTIEVLPPEGGFDVEIERPPTMKEKAIKLAPGQLKDLLSRFPEAPVELPPLKAGRPIYRIRPVYGEPYKPKYLGHYQEEAFGIAEGTPLEWVSGLKFPVKEEGEILAIPPTKYPKSRAVKAVGKYAVSKDTNEQTGEGTVKLYRITEKGSGIKLASGDFSNRYEGERLFNQIIERAKEYQAKGR